MFVWRLCSAELNTELQSQLERLQRQLAEALEARSANQDQVGRKSSS